MNAEVLTAKFARMGARLRLGELTGMESRRRGRVIALDIGMDDMGEFFDIRLWPKARVELEVADLRRREHHLLLHAHGEGGRHFYLCGHDERHWFVAAVPERVGPVTNVFAAMEALKPPEILEAQQRQGIKGKDRQRRKNAAYVRQGEWFFLPAPKVRVDNKAVLRNEPLSRGNGSKPHWAEFLFRRGGEAVYVCDELPQGVTVEQYVRLLRDRPRAKSWKWRRMVRNPEAFVKGSISHPDHKTIGLHVWHKVVMNTEGQSEAMRDVVFLD